MKKKILVIALFILIIFTFSGCRKLGSDVNSTVSGLGSAVSGTVSQVESAGGTIGSAISGTVSGVASALTSSK